jgi:hypothetical protein
MKRNYDLIREILRAVEKRPKDGRVIILRTEEFTDWVSNLTSDELDDHIQMLVEHGFLEAAPHQFGWFITKLTWDAHDFIEQSKETTVWENVKYHAGHFLPTFS